MIYIGNQTSFAASTPTEPFDYAIANAFDAFEWFPDKKPGAGWDEHDLTPELRAQIRHAAEAQGMRLSLHARWQANPLEPAAAPLLEIDLSLARELGATLLNLHLYEEQGLGAFIAGITPLAQRCAEAGLALSIENTPNHSPELFNELFARLAGTNSVPAGRVGMCLDIGHANLCSATRNNYLSFVDRLTEEVPIIHLHLHENWGDADTHLPLFTGPSAINEAGIRGLIERLTRRGFAGSIILEQWPQPPTLLNQARDRLRQLLPEPLGVPPLGGKSLRLGVPPLGGESLNYDHPPSTKISPPKGGTPNSEAHPLNDEAEQKKTGSPDSVPAQEKASASSAETANKDVRTSSFTEALVAADRNSRSWREKLDSVRNLLASDKSPLDQGALAEIAAYLQFLRTGQIRCEEDGRHFRPGHHAGIALEIRKHLAERTTPADAFLLRKIYPWLPSSSQTFRAAEPLTRIRAIAHRNDIPADLKREIKTSLQNKLHRCAGPEDLVTSAALLQRVTSPGSNFPPAFVQEFKIFHEELKEFFNARSLEEQLRALAPRVGRNEAELIQAILERKREADSTEQLATLTSATELRHYFSKPNPKQGAVEAQELQMADLGLEDFVFARLSEIINLLEAHDGDPDWPHWLQALGLAINNICWSGIEPEECAATASELRAWGKALNPSDPVQLLRLKATVERTRRLAENYCGRILGVFTQRALALGQALGVEQNALKTFGEGNIRAHIVFQASKLVSGLLSRLRERLGLPPWDVLVPGQAAGRLRKAERLENLSREDGEPEIVLLRQAAGDEDIPKGIAGILLAHALPHLSHLGVRARQGGVVFACCEEPAQFEEFEPLEGKAVSLSATAERVECRIASTSTTLPKNRPKPRIPVVQVALGNSCIPLEQADLDRAGAKASNLRKLAELARLKDAGFKTAPAVVVPFGVLETALCGDPRVETKYRQSLKATAQSSSEKLVGIADELRTLIQRLPVPREIVSYVAKEFRRDARLMARSSANCEDLAELSGAGLYESIAGVSATDVAPAVRSVWASLWSRRAALSRQEAGVPHEQARMAVVIQQMLTPELSFVIHTVNPINQDRREVYAELAVGLGETLVSGEARGNPYRLVFDKGAAQSKVLAFANFSQALVPNDKGVLIQKTLDYSRVPFSYDEDERARQAAQLSKAARFVETAFGIPLDIEGAIVGQEIFLVQARPQQGLDKRAQ